MTGREQRIYEEATALWREVHGDAVPPPPSADAIFDAITGGLPDVGYNRLCSPFLRAASITGPKSPARGSA